MEAMTDTDVFIGIIIISNSIIVIIIIIIVIIMLAFIRYRLQGS